MYTCVIRETHSWSIMMKLACGWKASCNLLFNSLLFAILELGGSSGSQTSYGCFVLTVLVVNSSRSESWNDGACKPSTELHFVFVLAM